MLASIASLAVMLVGIMFYLGFVNDLRIRDARDNLRDRLFIKKSSIEKSLYSRIYYTKSVAAYVAMNPEITNDEFCRLAAEFLVSDSVISTMALSKNCIIGAIYPLEDHESALGLNLLEHPKRRQIVEQTVRTRKTFVAGPVELIEGGIAFISYTPIFTEKGSSGKEFWGVTDIVIRRDRLFREAGMLFADGDFVYGMKGYDGMGAKGSVIWGDSAVFNTDPVTVDISLPTGSWVLAAAPRAGWDELVQKSDRLSLLLHLIAFFVAFLIWIIAMAQERIRTNAREFAAMFGAMDDLIIEFSSKGDYLQIAPTNDSHLVQPKNRMIGRNIYDLLDKPIADLHYNAIQECMSRRSKVVIEYSIDIGGETRWFQGRFSFMTSSSVMFMAEDISRKKADEEALKKSELLLRELNETKDKLFSVIAHDLRNPFSTFLGYTEILAEDTSSMSQVEIKNLALRMRNSAANMLGQLEDLLEWSQIQRGMIKFSPETIRLQGIVHVCTDEIRQSAERKEISVTSLVEESLEVFADRKMLRSVLVNLLGNAVKFTRPGGRVVVSAGKGKENGVLISVKDSGIGMTSEIISGLFTMDLHISRKGTEGEPSTGLGLILCKEFVDRHNGLIWADSEVGEGSTFNVFLPYQDEAKG